MIDILAETLIDNIKLFPFLFFTYLFLEYMEHHTSDKFYNTITKANHHGPFLGSLCAAIPQCGFSVVASNLYAVRMIGLGTLISIYLATSDEMIPILISSNIPASLILKIIGYKICCGMLFGYLIDKFQRKNKPNKPLIHDLCEHENCHCGHGIFRPALYHSIKIAIFIFSVSLLLNILFTQIPAQKIVQYTNYPLWGELVGGIFGLFPNCSASVILTQLYLENCINIGILLTGSLSNAGVALLMLFRVNRPIKQNVLVTLTLLICALIGGLLSYLIF